eukprot:scaffold50222_cov39-Prasinocladus_malaysianus.AAC.2
MAAARGLALLGMVHISKRSWHAALNKNVCRRKSLADSFLRHPYARRSVIGICDLIVQVAAC